MADDPLQLLVRDPPPGRQASRQRGEVHFQQIDLTMKTHQLSWVNQSYHIISYHIISYHIISYHEKKEWVYRYINHKPLKYTQIIYTWGIYRIYTIAAIAGYWPPLCSDCPGGPHASCCCGVSGGFLGVPSWRPSFCPKKT